jgi:hypothetical protein
MLVAASEGQAAGESRYVVLYKNEALLERSLVEHPLKLRAKILHIVAQLHDGNHVRNAF